MAVNEKPQGAPFSVQVEMTEGCNLRCPFCGLNGIRGPKDQTRKFLTLEVAERIACEIARVKWNSRIEFAMHGEPTLNHDAEQIVGLFRKYLPKAHIMMLSNGGGLMGSPEQRIGDLFRNGLDTLGIDEYKGVSYAEKLWGQMVGISKRGTTSRLISDDQTVYAMRYPENPEGNPHNRKPYKRFIRIAPIDESTTGTHSSLNTHCGAGAPPESIVARCAKPFREMSFRWDGGVAVCCNDWRGELPIGNIMRSMIESLWQSPVMQSARRMLLNSDRGFKPCDKCNARSYRPGLLPDHKGQCMLNPPTDADRDLLCQAAMLGPMTAPVLREWEKPQ